MTGTKKVLFVQHSANFGGAPKSLYQIMSAFQDRNKSADVFFLRSGPVIESFLKLGLTVKVGNKFAPFHGSEVSGMNWKIAIRNILGLFYVPKAYTEHMRGYDVVYLNSSCLCFYGLIVKLFSPRTRIIFHLREPLLSNAWGKIIRNTVRFSADHVIAITQNELKNFGESRSSEVVYNYIRSQDYTRNDDECVHYRDKFSSRAETTVGFFARLNLTNGIRDFVNLATRLQDLEKVKFCIYGQTGEESWEVDEILASAPTNCKVYPMVENIAPQLGGFDILVVPFLVPHFSRSVIEAAMLGVPSIIYDLPSLEETVVQRQTGIKVAPKNLDEAEVEIRKLIEDPEQLERMSKASKSLAMDRFSENNFERIEHAIFE